MNPKMRCNLSGAFLAQDLGRGAWRLSRSEPPGIEVYLRGAQPDAAEALGSAALADIAVEWRADAAVLTLIAGQRPRTLKLQSAIIHEPEPRLLDALPLATFDREARRFWRNVFRLVRIPGGRFLLRILARRR